MYNCDNCGNTTAEGEKIKRIVMETRRKTYTGTYRDPKTYRYQTIEVGQGNEIVREIKVCTPCNATIEARIAGDGSTHRMVVPGTEVITSR